MRNNVYRSRPVSRVLSLDSHSSRPIVAKRLKQPTRMLGEQRRCILFGLAADGVWPATDCYQPHGALLPHHFTLTCAVLPRPLAVMLSVPLSVASRRPAVSRHPALCSPDFPPRPKARRLSGLLRYGRDYNGLGGKGYLKIAMLQRRLGFAHMEHELPGLLMQGQLTCGLPEKII